MEIDTEIVNALYDTVDFFRKELLKDKRIKKYIQNLENCESLDDYNFFLMFYVNECIDKKGGIQILYKKLVNKKVKKLKINQFIYSALKLEYKTRHKLWSFNELDELNIPIELMGDKSSNYKFF